MTPKLRLSDSSAKEKCRTCGEGMKGKEMIEHEDGKEA